MKRGENLTNTVIGRSTYICNNKQVLNSGAGDEVGIGIVVMCRST